MAQRDPLNEYKSEAFELFQTADRAVARSGDRADDAHRGALPGARAAAAADAVPASRPEARRRPEGDSARSSGLRSNSALGGRGCRAGFAASPLPNATRTIRRTWGKVGRNEPCPCGSGKKFKHCHGQCRLSGPSAVSAATTRERRRWPRLPRRSSAPGSRKPSARGARSAALRRRATCPAAATDLRRRNRALGATAAGAPRGCRRGRRAAGEPLSQASLAGANSGA